MLALGPDICVIASPAALHHGHARGALIAGAHALVEKPVTIRPNEAWDKGVTTRRLVLAEGLTSPWHGPTPVLARIC